MNYDIINCYELDFAQNIPKELTALKAQNNQLIKEKQKLKSLLIFVGIGTGILLTIKLIHHARKSKKEKQA